jgi:ribonuclease D
MTKPQLLSNASDILGLVEELRGHDTIAFDTEFIRENTFYPITEIIQVATSEKTWLVDAQAFKKGYRPGPAGSFDPGLKPLLEVFQDPKVLKIVHAAQGDQECLYTSFGVLASPVLDTAVAASLCGLGDNIGLGKLLKSVLNVTIKKGHARTNWSVRPLPQQLLEYAAADVDTLVQLGKKLLEMLEPLGRREWALTVSSRSAEKSLYDPDYEQMAQRLARGGRLDKRGYSALRHLVKWREERVRQLNLPRRWVADDAVLIDLAQVRPKDMQHLSAFRGLNKGELKHSGEAILAALQKAAEDPATLPPSSGSRGEMPSTEEAQVLDLLKCYVGILADRHRIAAKHISTAGQLLPLLREKLDTPEQLVKAGLLTREAAMLVGEELIAFVRGKRALLVEGTQIRVREL